MADKAKEKKSQPDLMAMSFEERALWLLDRLREQEGEPVNEDGTLWWHLSGVNKLPPLMMALAPGLTKGQVEKINNWLGAEGLRYSDNLGRGQWAHYILLPKPVSGSAAAGPKRGAGVRESIQTDEGGDEASSAREQVRRLMELLRTATDEVNRLREENQQQSSRIGELEKQVDEQGLPDLAGQLDDAETALRKALEG